jgi:methylated-DNA-[protein]-cysteine S-methyltransferase
MKPITQKMSPLSNTVFSKMDTPIGELILLASSVGLHAIRWSTNREEIALTENNKHPILLEAKQQLMAYFQHKRKDFNLPLAPQGSDFQIRAWQVLQKIPYGKTISYSEQATQLGDKNKARAVGLANSKNPLSIVVPCHRVIGKNGELTGFAGGLSNKAFLLALEKQQGF